MLLAGKTALVTGANQGIGLSIATALAKEGAFVAGACINKQFADEFTGVFTNEKLAGQGFVLDVTDYTTTDKVIADITAACGVPTILVNNAGITRDNLMLRMKHQEWDDVIKTDLSSVYNMSKACLRGMMKERWGRIVNISSVVAYSGNPGQANYTAAKAGLIGFSKSLAQEVASRGITVNAVAPGFIDTKMTQSLNEDQINRILERVPVGRMGTAEEVANAVLFLASPNTAYITGTTIHVNGGMYMA